MENKAAQIVNSYDNTDELLKKFPVLNPTPVETSIEKRIQNRLLSGFNNWNLGTDAWLAWGNILYTPDSLYNIHGVHMTLKQYQMFSGMAFKAAEMMMGDFHNMVICDDWCAICYDIASRNRATGTIDPGMVMEFVHFKDEEPAGCTVVEGWAGGKGADYPALLQFLSPEQKEAQASFEKGVVEGDCDLHIANPTKDNSEWAEEIRALVLKEFAAFNEGYEAWEKAADEMYTKDMKFFHSLEEMDLDGHKALVKEDIEEKELKRVYFHNLMVSGEWAALYYRTRKKNPAAGEVEAYSDMEFVHFTKEDGTLKADFRRRL